MPFVQTAALDLHYETGGSGKDVLLLLHGNFASWRWWRPVLKSLPPGYCAYAPDMRGCGDSDHPEDGYSIEQHAEDMDQLTQALGLPRFHLVGHSLGGCVALEYALKHPKRVKTLTLVAPAPGEGRTILEATGYGHAFAGSSGSLHSAFRMSERFGTTRKVFQRALARMVCESVMDRDSESLVNDAVRMSTNAAVGHVESLYDWDVRDALCQLNLPVLIIGGRNDELISAEALRQAAQKIPKGRLILWPGMGHTPQLERPGRFVRILQKFTSQHTHGMPDKVRRIFCSMMKNMSKSRDHENFLLCD